MLTDPLNADPLNEAKDQGSIKQTAVTSELAGANISLTSGSNIALQGATLTANNTLSMGAATGTLQAVTQDTDGHYVNANGVLSTLSIDIFCFKSSRFQKNLPEIGCLFIHFLRLFSKKISSKINVD
ncbi:MULTISPECIES: hypothetical protein [Marinomonas]|uniref:Hemagglutinin repeat-containing protein n=1 Tax=Marinomonas arctica TaxID=383750 RepID=A0A7H1J366_9GAMM|nr:MULTISPECIES: hypothetical protein [Marinomonas]MCS7485905.1 hypothetical protein [Marinomonas sp. BSi20414]QNT04932.1 hypothetical protein IBG28_14670 [Marinomonas arctica]GGN17417.1 hypothetical protein GCM10011350_03040 [Marinomonas arctica]